MRHYDPRAAHDVSRRKKKVPYNLGVPQRLECSRLVSILYDRRINDVARQRVVKDARASHHVGVYEHV